MFRLLVGCALKDFMHQLHRQLLTVLIQKLQLCTHLLIVSVLGVQLLPGANPQRRVDYVHGGDGGDGSPASRL